jgi:hypothetical protein
VTTDVRLETTPAVTVRVTIDLGQSPLTLDVARELVDGLENLVHLASPDRKMNHSVCVVQSLSYNSPLEIVLGISGAAGAVTFTADSLVRVWIRWQKARQEKARADLQVAATQVLLDLFETTNPKVSGKPKPVLGDPHSSAAKVLREITSLEVDKN